MRFSYVTLEMVIDETRKYLHGDLPSISIFRFSNMAAVTSLVNDLWRGTLESFTALFEGVKLPTKRPWEWNFSWRVIFTGLGPLNPLYSEDWCWELLRMNLLRVFTFSPFPLRRFGCFFFQLVQIVKCLLFEGFYFNPLTAEWALRALRDYTLSNVRRFYSSMGNPFDGKGLTARKLQAHVRNSRHFLGKNQLKL